MRRQIRPLLVVAAALSLASCGGGGGGGERPDREGPKIAKTRFVQRADAVCTRDQARLTAALARVPAPDRSGRAGISVIAPYLALNADAIRSGTRRIEALGRPSTDGDLLYDYLDERVTAANALDA